MIRLFLFATQPPAHQGSGCSVGGRLRGRRWNGLGQRIVPFDSHHRLQGL